MRYLVRVIPPLEIASAARRYLRSHPEELRRAIRSSFGLRFGVPLAVFRWLVEQLLGETSGLDPSFDAVPPGLRIGATVERMDTRMRVSMLLYVHDLRLNAEELHLELRFEQVHLQVLSEQRTIPAALIRSGALRLDALGALIGELPGIPDFVVRAEDNRVCVDLLKVPRLRDNRALRHAVGLVSSLVTVGGVRTDVSHLDVQLQALPEGRTGAAGALRAHLLRPGARRVRRMLGLDRRLLSPGGPVGDL